MEIREAVQRLGALAHETRLSVFRLLVRRGPLGLPAGEIATRMGISPPNASFHLAELARVGLVTAKRDGRSVIYSVDFAASLGLVDYLKENCCAEEVVPVVPLNSITRRKK
ncbi:MAG TPA: metalloregulator ArsR/SmtB family transcription factor [Vicinamibacteria bacterium]|mgnify:FL=1|nr:metalloregulator ArsR/SmtB family transcription factor [Vicinamibacteria bacterium]